MSSTEGKLHHRAGVGASYSVIPYPSLEIDARAAERTVQAQCVTCRFQAMPFRKYHEE